MNLNQILQEKFPHLEVSVLKFSEAQKDKETKRIDSEFFRKVDLAVKNKLAAIQSKYLFSLVSSNSRYSQPNYDKQSSLKIINSQYIRNEFIDYENAKCGYGAIVPKEAILINSTGVGTLGRVNINLLDRKFSIDSHINVLIVKDKNELNPCYLMIFLQTKYGQSQINRYYSGTSGQIEIYPRDFNNFLIPLLPISFQLEIEKLVKDSHLALEQSKALYKEAESLLYTELGLNPSNPMQGILNFDCYDNKKNHINYSIHTLKESFLKTGRLDSEYYQVKYEEIEKRIKTYTNGYCKLKDIVVSFSGGFAFSSNEYLENGDLALIRINNIKNANLDMNNAVYLNDEAISLSPKDKVKKGDILISMSGSIGLSCVVRETLHAMVNQRILKISIDGFNADVLVLLLNSVLCKLQFERIGTGGVQTNLATSDILNILIPKINPNTQDSIASYIES